MAQIRQTYEIFGTPCELTCNVLPTYFDIMKGYLWWREYMKAENKKDPSVLDISQKLLIDIKNVWQKASLPIISDQRIIQKVKDYNEKYKALKKNIKSVYNKKCLAKIEVFKKDSLKLFDISPCKCNDFSKCHCEIKIPLLEREFLVDQRTTRKMVIGNIDITTTKKNIKSFERYQITAKRMERKEMAYQKDVSRSSKPDSDKSTDEEKDLSEEKNCGSSSFSFIETEIEPFKIPCKRKLDLKNLAKACDRTGVSDRSASLIVNAALKDFNIITKDPLKIIDRSRIRRQRKKHRFDLIDSEIGNKNLAIAGIYFDGRKDKTLVVEKNESSCHRRIIMEEHIVIIAEPNSKYLGHISPTSGSANDISTSILNFLENLLGENLNNIVAMGCDGTVVNTGTKNGILKHIEVSLKKPIQWFICLLHANELPLRHLIHQLDGKTNDPKGFSGVIGKLLGKCEHMPVVKFPVIEVDLPLLTFDELSTDQKYLYEMCLAIKSGNVSQQLAEKQPGKISHSRWLTTANRILRLYVATEDLSESLKILAEYVVRVYATSWFLIKCQSSCKDGSKHLFNMIKLSRYLPNVLKKIVDPVIQRNGYFAHPENILLAMLGDDRKHIRELALSRILQCRNSNPIDSGIREFRVPNINFEAKDYIDLIDWQTIAITEPPLTKNISESDLQEMILKMPDEIEIFKFPCHTQAVERHIKLVTEASSLVCGTTARDGLIRARISSRQELPQIETRRHFCDL